MSKKQNKNTLILHLGIARGRKGIKKGPILHLETPRARVSKRGLFWHLEAARERKGGCRKEAFLGTLGLPGGRSQKKVSVAPWDCQQK